ncbi:MAG: glycosyltransferase family 4 protein [PVC group bacterium]
MSSAITNRPLRIVYVCPRYAAAAAGGAEALIQSWAERMKERGHHSEVLTTCARDHSTWKNELPPGEEMINGIPVHRFEITSRNREKQDFYGGRIIHGEPLTRGQEEEWIDAVAWSEPLRGFIEQNRTRFDCFIFAPYLFGVTYRGMPAAPGRSILVPCLHDEPYAYLKIFRDLFSSAAGIFFNSEPERRLADRIFSLPRERCRVVGMGIEPPAKKPQPDRFREKYGIDSPYLLYAGRREGGKNTPLLIEYFRLFKRHRGTDLRLCLLGTGEVALRGDDRRWILDAGYVSGEDKRDAYAGAFAFCQPSTNESFSIVLLESWLEGKPALVNDFCPVTRDHCLRSGGGLYFRDYFEFEECLLYLLDYPAQARRMGENGRRYVEYNYAWGQILDKLEEGLKACFNRRSEEH